MTSTSTDRRHGVNSGAAVKVPVKAASTAALTLSGEQTVDGVALVDGDRILVKDQASGVNNGIYTVDTGAWERDVDFDGAYDVKRGTLVFVYSGTTNGNKIFKQTTADPITVGTTALAFEAMDIDIAGLFNAVGDVAVGIGSGEAESVGASPLPINLTLSCSVGSNALTIAIKGRDGNDPSATNPVFIPFRSATAATGDYSWVMLTAATSLVLSNGSTLGTNANVANRLWIVAFNDAGTVRIGAINCVSTAAGGGAGRDVTIILPIAAWGIASSTAEGGAGGADSPQVFYTGTAVSSKAYTVLGYATYESGLGTAGVYASVPTRLQLFGPDVPLPGRLIQTARTDTGAVATGTTTVPNDDTIPQITEGDQYMTQAITPTSAANALCITAKAQLANSNGGTVAMITSLFQDATANAIATVETTILGATVNRLGPVFLDKMILASTTSATTFRLRAGGSGAGTTTFNGSAGSRLYGGVYNSYLQVQEIMG